LDGTLQRFSGNGNRFRGAPEYSSADHLGKSLLKGRQRMKSNTIAYLTSGLLLFAGACGYAQTGESKWSVDVGASHFIFDTTSTNLAVAGKPFPGAKIDLDENTTMAVVLNYRATQDWVLRLALGIPPTTKLRAEGSLRNYVPPLTGTLGQVRYGAAMFTTTYDVIHSDTFTAFIGGGFTEVHIFNAYDGDVGHLRVGDMVGPAIEAGGTVAITPKWHWFVDARAAYIEPESSGNLTVLGGVPGSIRMHVVATILSSGIEYRF
jgi:outer membrane protein